MNFSLNQAVQILTQPHPLHSIWQIYLSQIQAQALDFSIEKKLFASLFQFEDATVLAKKHALHPQNTDYLLQLLASLQLLDTQFDPTRQAMLYRIKPALKDYVDPISDQYCVDALLYRQQVIQSVAGQLSVSFSRDFQAQSRTPETIGSAWAQAAQIQIAQEQNAVTVHIADVLSDVVREFKTARHFLDVGAGAGRVAMHMAEKFAQLECTLLELPHVIEAIRPTLTNHPAHQRLHCLAADLQSLDFQTLDFQTLKSQPQYDIIWCSS
ncbi:MAG: methyltransferase, partial [Acinetobacter guillouiae]